MAHSLKYGSSTRIMLWIDTSTCRSVDLADHCSSGLSGGRQHTARERE